VTFKWQSENQDNTQRPQRQKENSISVLCELIGPLDVKRTLKPYFQVWLQSGWPAVLAPTCFAVSGTASRAFSDTISFTWFSLEKDLTFTWIITGFCCCSVCQLTSSLYCFFFPMLEISLQVTWGNLAIL